MSILLLELVKPWTKIFFMEIKHPCLDTVKIKLTLLSPHPLLDTDPQEVNNVIVGLKSDSAPGWDNIPAKYLNDEVP